MTTILSGFTVQQIALRDAVLNVARSGDGPPLLLLHGYPQTHAMWHKIAPELAKTFTVVAPDLRGYGDSSKPPSDAEHFAYSKRAMAQDCAELMDRLGFAQFAVAGHDRGGRVAHRLCLDHPARITRAAVLDIAPTYTMFATANKAFGDAYYHWFFLSQPFDLPERLIGADPGYYLWKKLQKWGRDEAAFAPKALAEYQRCFANPATIHASCEDYRAAATIDLVHDEADLGRKIACPLLVLWGAKGFVAKHYDVLATWRERADTVVGRALPSGHFLPEEAPEATMIELHRFFAGTGAEADAGMGA